MKNKTAVTVRLPTGLVNEIDEIKEILNLHGSGYKSLMYTVLLDTALDMITANDLKKEIKNYETDYKH